MFEDKEPGAVVGMRVRAISDLHTDYEENLTWVKDLSCDKYREDVLIVSEHGLQISCSAC